MSAGTIRAIVLDKKDNVATAMSNLKGGDIITVSIEDYTDNISLSQDIPFGHKFALQNIHRGGAIVKYGEIIGRARNNIGKGEHTHVHNVEGLRGRGDKR
ncbi:MAG: UxaA family hydrolase [Dehalococcoidales bacterium]